MTLMHKKQALLKRHLFGHRRAVKAFTLIELLIVLAIVALMLSLALPRYIRGVDSAKETLLRDNLRAVRVTIQNFYGDTGRYPESLDELVERRYLLALPVDPIVESSTQWQIVAPDSQFKGKVFDVRSGAEGVASDGRAYSAL